MKKVLFICLIALIFATQPLASAEPTESVVYGIEITYTIPNNSSSDARDVTLRVYLFDNRSGWSRQHVLSERFEVDGITVIPETSRTDENRTALFSLGTIRAGRMKTVKVLQTIKVDRTDLKINPNNVGEEVPIELLQYTQPIAYLWESDNPTLLAKARELTENTTNPYRKVECIFEFVKTHLTYTLQPEEHSALWAYNSRVGDCSEHTHLITALARAVGIPTKFVSAYGYDRTKGGDLAQMGHAFLIAYLPNIGWVPVDATWSRPAGELGLLSHGKIVQFVSDGKDLVRNMQIRIPSDKINYSYTGSDPNPILNSASTITRNVAVEATLSAGAQIEDGAWRWTATVNNVGTVAIENIRVELQADNTYFEASPAQNVGSLGAGHNRPVTFDVRVKKSVENSLIKSVITYDTPYGTFMTKAERSATVFLPQYEWEFDMTLLSIVATISVVVPVVIAFLVRRR